MIQKSWKKDQMRKLRAKFEPRLLQNLRIAKQIQQNEKQSYLLWAGSTNKLNLTIKTTEHRLKIHWRGRLAKIFAKIPEEDKTSWVVVHYFGFCCIFINKFFKNLTLRVLCHTPLPPTLLCACIHGSAEI